MLQAPLCLDQPFTNWYPIQTSQCLINEQMAQTQQFSGPTPVHVLPDGNYAPPVFMPGIPSQQSMLDAVDKLKYFLLTAPSTFDTSPYDPNDPVAREERCLNRFQLPTGELISCVLWNNLYHVSGTDIVRALHFRFAAFGRPVRNAKKFEEGIFSDLRNLKSGTDATLEEPKSDFLELLFKYNCIRTQKKQKVFFWWSVPHDRLFLDALDRDLKREKLGVEPTTEAVAEPALSFVYNPNKSLYEQFTEQKALEGAEPSAPSESEARGEEEAQNPPPPVVVTEAPEAGGEGLYRTKRRPSQITTNVGTNGSSENGTAVQEADGSQVLLVPPSKNMAYRSASGLSSIASADEYQTSSPPSPETTVSSAKLIQTFADPNAGSIFGAFSLFEGSPTYKQRRKPGQKRPTKKNESSPGVASHSASPMPGAEFEDHYHPRPSSSSGLAVSSISNQPLPGHPYHQSCDRHLRPSPMSPHLPLSAVSSSGDFSVLNPLEGSIADPNSTPQQEMGTYGASRAYVCPLFSCGRLFKRLEHLKRHLRIHTSEKPYPCTRCGKRFARRDNLAAHLKIHEKLAARAGSTSSSDQRALEAEEELDERMSSLLESMEHVDDSEHPGSLSPPNGQLQTPHLFGASNHTHQGYYTFQQGLPTPPNAYQDQPGCWPQYNGYPAASSVLTPDQSPDPPNMYGMHGHGPRPHSMESNLNFGPDNRRFRSATPADIRGIDNYTRHSSAGPRIVREGMSGQQYTPPQSSAESMRLSGESPMLHQFQTQLNIVNNLHAEIEQEGLLQQSFIHASAGDPRRPGFASLENVASREQFSGTSHSLMTQSPPGGQPPASYPPTSAGQSEFTNSTQEMPPPSQPASSYPNHSQAEESSFQKPAQQLIF